MIEPQAAKAFIDDIIAVCRKHKLVITVSMYDGFQVHTLDEARDPLIARIVLEQIQDAEIRT